MYAQLNHLKPHNHNWSDIDFLKNNLLHILPDTPSPAYQIDAQGQFNCCPYSLRIYTSSDLSHFLLIAQPAPSLLNWLIPQSLIVVDSHLMELRILKDVRSLNRLLANSSPLDGNNGKEITTLIKQEGLIRLANLAAETGQQDFAPPKNLGWIRPGAENLIYNAPRYYLLGHSIVQKSLVLANTKSSSEEVAALKRDIENLSTLSQCVIYSDQGKKSALLMRQEIMLFAPTDKLLFGYILFNSQGKINQVFLLKEDDEGKKELFPNLDPKESDPIALITPAEMAISSEPTEKPQEQPSVDFNHPIYIHLHSLVMLRENELKPLVGAINQLVSYELQYPRTQFQEELHALIHHYMITNGKHKQTIQESLDSLYHQYENISTHEFLKFIKALKLDLLIQQEEQSIGFATENWQRNFDHLKENIEKSQSITELDQLIHTANSWLNFEFIKDPNELMKYQNLLRNQLLEQLKKCLISSKKNFPIKANDKECLKHLLSYERLIKPEEREFFLEEFHHLFAVQKPIDDNTSSEEGIDID